MKYKLMPLTLKQAKEFVNEYHRHNVAPYRDKFRVGLTDGDKLIGVVMVGRPIARYNDDGQTLEVTRLCVLDGYKDACSMLYGTAWRATKALGYIRLITYTLKEESGTSLKASGFKIIGETKHSLKGWDRPSRPREKPSKYPDGQKTIWELKV